MTVSRAIARVGGVETAGDGDAAARERRRAPEELVLEFAQPLPAGPAVIEITYDAPFATDLAGLYRVEEQGRWYAYTQFESTDARRAFPCFDEPGFKTPYDVTILAPAGMIALSNSPEIQAARTGGPGTGALLRPGTFRYPRPLAWRLARLRWRRPAPHVRHRRPRFRATSWPSPWATSTSSRAARSRSPSASITTKGRAHLAGLALDVAAALVDSLGDYFGMRYPYAKLDLVAVPDFAAGAMENPGLVTFRDVLLLVDPLHATTSTRRAQAEVIAHEFAHQWFGDLVTMKWWNDIWLNEGFATWAEAKIVDQWKPNFGATMGQIASVEHVMDTDALRSARAVREPVRSTSDAMEAFDGITYQKGAAVLRMIESFLGPDVFQRGVQRYVHENAWKNASADDLFKALDFVSTQKVDALASGFLDHPGVPQVFSSYKCDWAAPAGSSSASPSGILWANRRRRATGTRGRSPSASRSTGRSRATASRSARTPSRATRAHIRAPPGCTRTRTRPGTTGSSSNATSSSPSRTPDERSTPPSGSGSSPTRGRASGRERSLRPPCSTFSRSSTPRPTGTSSSRSSTRSAASTRRSSTTARARPTRSTWGRASPRRKRALGWWPPSGHEELDDDAALERRSVLWALGELANDETTLAEADRYARAWLRDRSNVAADTAAVAVPLASIGAGEARLVELREAARSSPTPEDRVIAIRAMGMFDDPVVLRKAFDLALSDELKLSEWRYLFGAASGHRPARPVLFAWEKENWGKLRARAPNSLARGMVDVAGTMCTHADQDDAQAFFSASDARAWRGSSARWTRRSNRRGSASRSASTARPRSRST